MPNYHAAGLTGATINMPRYYSVGSPQEPFRWRPLNQRCRGDIGPYEWTVAAPGKSEGRGYYAADDAGTPGDSTFFLRSCEIPSKWRHGRVWYTAEMTAFYPVVLRLPRSRGFLTGWTMGCGMISSVDFDIFADENEAWRCAIGMARDAASEEEEQNSLENETEDEE